jgi:Cdc6-like AAA superfamily ATPase
MKEFLNTKLWPFLTRSLLIKSTIAVITSAIASPFVIDHYDSNKISSVLKNGQKKLLLDVEYFPRKFLEQNIIQAIGAGDDAGNYFLLVGEHGTGKTSLVQRLVENSTSGMIYVSCPKDANDFGKSFANAILYSTIYNPPLWRKVFTSLSILPSTNNIKKPMPEYWACEEKFFQAVERYKAETGHAPILVIDDVNNFLANDIGKEFLLQLQKLAKECAVSVHIVMINNFDLYLYPMIT